MAGLGNLIAHLLLRYVRYLAEWRLSYSRLSGVIRREAYG
jgi:hypothetical protein